MHESQTRWQLFIWKIYMWDWITCIGLVFESVVHVCEYSRHCPYNLKCPYAIRDPFSLQDRNVDLLCKTKRCKVSRYRIFALHLRYYVCRGVSPFFSRDCHPAGITQTAWSRWLGWTGDLGLFWRRPLTTPVWGHFGLHCMNQYVKKRNPRGPGQSLPSLWYPISMRESRVIQRFFDAGQSNFL